MTPTPTADCTVPEPECRLGLVMGGGGARAAYQVGVLRGIARRLPELRVPIITGVSAGGINAAHLANHHGTFEQAMAELAGLWSALRIEDVFRVDSRTLLWTAMRWAGQLLSGGHGGRAGSRVQGLVDTDPLRGFLTEVLHAVDGELTGVSYNLSTGRLRAAALSTADYTTGQSVTWIQGTDIEEWERPHRRALHTVLTVEHVMASAALPLFFPAVRIGDHWYGDGQIRLTAPLSPAVHLGADRILVISTRYDRSVQEAEVPAVSGYPPPAQVAGVLMNSIFLDQLDADALRLERLNEVLEKVPPEERGQLRIIDELTIRPSEDLGRLANDYEPTLPRSFRFLLRGLGTRETESPDFLSLILFEPLYLQRLMEMGEADVEARWPTIESFLRGSGDVDSETAPDDISTGTERNDLTGASPGGPSTGRS